jgi:hypothetical protein
LTSKHAYLTVNTRTGVAQTVRARNHLAGNEDEVVYPEPASEPIPHLGIWQDGFKCEAKENDTTTCGYIRRSVQDMQLLPYQAHLDEPAEEWTEIQGTAHGHQQDVDWRCMLREVYARRTIRAFV